MSRRSWFRHPISSFKGWRAEKRLEAAADETKSSPPLREFVYLDAVSLHSLLVSQNATIPNEVSQAISRADEAELAGTVSTKMGSELVGGAAQAETSTRYQTSNSNSTQSSRKAVIQTLFKELRELPLDFKLADRSRPPTPLKNLEAIPQTDDTRAVEAASAFKRGTLVEVEVTLAVDPVFKLGAMMTEWSAMADEFPAMFGNHGVLDFLRDSEPIMKVLDRFLAGLIPIKATATNYVVAAVDGKEYVVHKAAVEGLPVDTRALRIAGVTEHIGYWKDVRRVLFSDAEFTILGRVARDGIHEKWTPVKLADLFSEVVPGFVDQINAIRSPSASDTGNTTQQKQQVALGRALEEYKMAIIPNGSPWRTEDEEVFQAIKHAHTTGATDAVVQRRAFDAVRDVVLDTLALGPMGADVDLELRQSARAAAGLELFPSFAVSYSQATPSTPEIKDRPDERLLDVEVIAIYW